jgi:hypothetical protein
MFAGVEDVEACDGLPIGDAAWSCNFQGDLTSSIRTTLPQTPV